MSRSARHRSPAWSPCARQPAPPAAPPPHDGPPAPRQAARGRRRLEGVLKKYTNLLQGWQSRYFILDPEVGQLQYYLNQVAKSQRPPRGSLPLLGAKVVSSRDFPFMFTIQSTRGDFYKLRALDAQEQELWMTQLQLCSRRHSDSSAKVISQAEGQQRNLLNSTESPPHQDAPLSAQDDDRLILKSAPSATLSCLGECLTMFQHNVVQALNQNQNQNHLPSPLLIHSTGGLSQAALAGRVKLWTQRCGGSVAQAEPGGLGSGGRSPSPGLNESPGPGHGVYAGRQGSVHNHVPSRSQRQDSTQAEIYSSKSRKYKTQKKPHEPEQEVTSDGPTGWSRCPSDAHMAPPSSACPPSTQKEAELLSERGQQHGRSSCSDTPDPNEETTDTEDNEEEDLGVLDDQRNIILHLLSQLKLGMDLTRVVLPTFILEKRSLLEMYANFMAHPDMFLSITSGCTAEERIIRFVEYYLTAFHEGRKGAVAKKPYNPILGESFHCSWHVPRDCVRTLRTTSCAGPNSAPVATAAVPGGSSQKGSSQRGTDGRCKRNSDCYRVRFVAEQVSHHPPVSGFYCECKEKRMCINTHIWTKSKFMGMSVGVSMVGEGVLYLLEHDEEYVFTLPCAYARSILTVPWVELGGKVTISCAKSGYSATVTFHTKPFYGGKVHRVTAEVKHNQTGNTVCKAQGEWNGMLEFSYNNGENKVIDTSKLPITRKRIRPLDKQSQYESRRLWQHVTASLKAGNMDAATEHKRCLEERQRSESKQRATAKTSWSPKFFIKEGEGWVYHNPLWKAH